MNRLTYSLYFLIAGLSFLSNDSFTQGFIYKTIENRLEHLKKNSSTSRSIFLKHKQSLIGFPELNTFLPKQKLDSTVNFNKDFPENSNKTYYEYNSNGLLVTLAYLEWDTTLNDWINNLRFENYYDAKNQVISRILFDGNQKLWNPIYKVDYQSNAQGNFILSKGFDWDVSTSSWVLYGKDTFSYNQKGLLQQIESFIWNHGSSQFENYLKAIELYNTQDQWIMETGSEWDAGSSRWIYSYNTEWTYHPNGKIFQTISANWDEIQADWHYTLKTEDYYNTQNQLTGYIDFNFENNLNQWVQFTKTDLQYDGNGNLIEELYSIWNLVSPKWEILYKSELNYDNNVARTELILPSTNPIELNYFNHKLIKQSFFYYDQGTFIYDGDLNFYYSPIDIVSTKDLPENLIKCFPNPSNGFIRFDLKPESSDYKLSIFELQGMIVKSQRLDPSHAIDLTTLENGMYFYELCKGSLKISKGKIIICK